MADNVVSIGGALTPPQVDAAVVKALEEALAEAKAGNVKSIVIAWGSTSAIQNYYMQWRWGEFALACQLFVGLQARFNRDALEGLGSE